MIFLEHGHRAREPYPLDASEQELLFSELTPERQRLSLFAANTVRDMYRNLRRCFVAMREWRRLLFPDRAGRR